jgi:type IV pilus assembly protein PilY1
VAFGSGPTHLDAFSTQTAKIFVVDLKQGPSYSDINKTSGTSGAFTCSTSSPCLASNTSVSSGAVRVYPTNQTGAFMADAVTLDSNLDFRVDVVYAGSVICNGTTTSSGCTGSGPMWKGAMWRLTTNGGNTDPDNWGINTGCVGFPRCPSKLISQFAYTSPQATTCASTSPCNVGPISSAPALTQDDTHSIWLFFGTGRFYASTDKTNTDIQHFFGVKDCIINGGCTDQTVERNNLHNSSNVVVCSSCASGSNVSTTGSTSSFTIGFNAGGGNLVNNVQNVDGWFTTYNDPTKAALTPPQPTITLGERNVTTSTLIGGTVFFTTFTPTTDICTASGTGQLYGVFYLTGGPYTSSAVGEVASGSETLVKKAILLGQGLPSQMAIQVGAQGTGTAGGASSTGCAGRVTGFIQAGGALGQLCGTPALSVWSRMISWRDL